MRHSGSAEILQAPLPTVLADARSAIPSGPLVADELARALADPAPARLEDGGAIRTGFDGELDAHRTLRDESRQVIATLQLDFAQRFGVASLKIKHHAQLGYVIEAPSVAVETLRGFPELTLRQGMANGARFTTPELSELDQRIREAAEKATARERLVFCSPGSRGTGACGRAGRLRGGACLSRCDAVGRETGGERHLGAADADRLGRIRIEAGRHPVVESALAGHTAFVPNRCDLSPDQRVMLLTGPNMAGKSTFLRQNALFVVLAQAGLPVPAESAEQAMPLTAISAVRSVPALSGAGGRQVVGCRGQPVHLADAWRVVAQNRLSGAGGM